MDVSLWDVERTFAAGNQEVTMSGKRKKELEEGETWRAKNVRVSRYRTGQGGSREGLATDIDDRSHLITFDYLNQSIICRLPTCRTRRIR